MTERRFIQIGNIWINPDSIASVIDDPVKDICTVCYRDLTETVPVVLREGARESFLHFLENNSYYIPTDVPSNSQVGRAIPATVLIDIFRAIMQDKGALMQAEKTMLPIRNDFTEAMSSILRYISEPEVRELAVNEIMGVKYDSDNK